MDIITSHNSLDFDGLASMLAAARLYPSAVPVISGTLARNVRRFMGLYKDSINVRTAAEIKPQEVSRLIVVDTCRGSRLGKLSALAGKTWAVYDHHPPGEGALRPVVCEMHGTGAATTILVERIQEKEIPVTPFEATIFALGIYEDTGSLSFPSTTSRDAAAVAFLLERGANLAVVNSFMETSFSGEQRLLLQKLMASACHYRIHGSDVVMALSEDGEFIPGLDLVTWRLGEVEAADAVFAVAFMEGKVQVVARSRVSNIKVNEILSLLGGGGHEKAASAVVKGLGVQEAADRILAAVKEKGSPAPAVRHVMSSPVKSIPAAMSMYDAGKLMLRYGHTGMPVMEDGLMVGIISRRDVDKALMHQLGHAPVKGFMSREVVSATPETSINEVQKIMVERDVGRLPVLEGDRLVGIVSRTDILRILHGEDYPEDHSTMFFAGDEPGQNCLPLMESRLPVPTLRVLEAAGEAAAELDCRAYCVGGFVRDLFLDFPNFDVDLVIEGDIARYAEFLAVKLGGKARVHERFKTAVLSLPGREKIDLATARTEFYESPAALPTVEKSSIKEDLYRRDFTINTIALSLNRGSFGEVIDFYGGLRDLGAGLIRILYNLSFVEDPTRIIRAIRFEKRYGFRMEPDTLRLARDAVERRLLGRLSYQRIQHELILILSERDPYPALQRMEEIGVWNYVLPGVILDDETRLMLRRTPRVLGWMAERQLAPGMRSWAVYLQVLLCSLPDEQFSELMEKYHFDRKTIASLVGGREVPALAAAVFRHPQMKYSELDLLTAGLSPDNLGYLLLCLPDEMSWEKVAGFLESRDNLQAEMRGKDLKRLGIRQGPVYQEILQRLRAARLDGEVRSLEEEMALAARYLEQGEK